MGIKEIFGLHIIDKNILYYAISVSLCAFGVGVAVEHYFKIGIPVASIFVLVGLILSNIFYNKILKRKFLDFK
ncbi:hypothetical protein HY637_04855 [Candidatus Woesearchaeota archaeon]|nr:hypothetical protein [Candidatus Woesearchaeota archaeon]